MILLFTIYLIWFYPTESLDVLAVFKKAKHRSVSTHKCELTCMTSCISNDFSELHVMLYICTYNIDYFFFRNKKSIFTYTYDQTKLKRKVLASCSITNSRSTQNSNRLLLLLLLHVLLLLLHLYLPLQHPQPAFAPAIDSSNKNKVGSMLFLVAHLQ